MAKKIQLTEEILEKVRKLVEQLGAEAVRSHPQHGKDKVILAALEQLYGKGQPQRTSPSGRAATALGRPVFGVAVLGHMTPTLTDEQAARLKALLNS